MKMTIDEISALDRAQFVAALGWIFEDSPWVAERAWASLPFRSADQLHEAMVAVVEHAEPAERLALLRAHPDLGTRVRIGDASAAEQAGAGLDRLTLSEFEKIQGMNAAYRAKFGFPFLFAVKGCAAGDILRALETRLDATPKAEIREALRQVYRIARFRLEEAVL